MKHLWLSALLVVGLGLISLEGAAQDVRRSRFGIGIYTDLLNACPGLQAEYSYRFTDIFSLAAQLSGEASWRAGSSQNRSTAMVYALFRPFSEVGFWRRFELGAGLGYERCFKSYPAQTFYLFKGYELSLSDNSYTIENNHLAGLDVPLRFYTVESPRYDIGLCATYRFRAGSGVVHGVAVGVQLGAKF